MPYTRLEGIIIMITWFGHVKFKIWFGHICKGERKLKICLKCKNICEDNSLEKCPKCKGELIPYSKEKYEYYIKNQKQTSYKSKEDRLYDDVHTIKNILIILCSIFVLNMIIAFISAIG